MISNLLGYTSSLICILIFAIHLVRLVFPPRMEQRLRRRRIPSYSSFPLSLVFPGVLAHHGLNDYSVITLLNPSLRTGPRGKATSVSKANELFSFLSLLPVLLPCSNLAAYPPSTNFTLIIVRNSFSICRVYIVVASLQIIYLKQRIK